MVRDGHIHAEPVSRIKPDQFAGVGGLIGTGRPAEAYCSRGCSSARRHFSRQSRLVAAKTPATPTPARLARPLPRRCTGPIRANPFAASAGARHRPTAMAWRSKPTRRWRSAGARRWPGRCRRGLHCWRSESDRLPEGAKTRTSGWPLRISAASIESSAASAGSARPPAGFSSDTAVRFSQPLLIKMRGGGDPILKLRRAIISIQQLRLGQRPIVQANMIGKCPAAQPLLDHRIEILPIHIRIGAGGPFHHRLQ